MRLGLTGSAQPTNRLVTAIRRRPRFSLRPPPAQATNRRPAGGDKMNLPLWIQVSAQAENVELLEGRDDPA